MGGARPSPNSSSPTWVPYGAWQQPFAAHSPHARRCSGALKAGLLVAVAVGAAWSGLSLSAEAKRALK
eukprot:PRCOL_00004108-RA